MEIKPVSPVTTTKPTDDQGTPDDAGNKPNDPRNLGVHTGKYISKPSIADYDLFFITKEDAKILLQQDLMKHAVADGYSILAMPNKIQDIY